MGTPVNCALVRLNFSTCAIIAECQTYIGGGGGLPCNASRKIVKSRDIHTLL